MNSPHASPAKRDAQIGPRGTLELLSRREVEALTGTGDRSPAEYEKLLKMFRSCALAVLNTGSESDDAAEIFAQYLDFDIQIAKRTRGLKLIIKNAPASAFVDGRMIEGVRQHLFAVLRDILYIGTDLADTDLFDDSSDGITDAVFHALQRAQVFFPDLRPNLVVCWGGHSISRGEYDYTKEVGYHLGLRGLDICTGCGPGAMKGPMKGAAVGHAKQRHTQVRYVGLTEPGIIAAEPPNPMVNQLVIMPDIEKRLEAFLRLGHCVCVFPGGAGTAEEILYLLGVLLDPANADQKLSLVFTGPETSADYFHQLDEFLRATLGEAIADRYEIIVGNAALVARRMDEGARRVKRQRRRDGDAYYFNWLIKIPTPHQSPFDATHENVAALRLSRKLPPHELVVQLRRAFSAIVAGNVKEQGVKLIAERGPFDLHCDNALAAPLDKLLRRFVADGRMTLASDTYEPCYRVVAD